MHLYLVPHNVTCGIDNHDYCYENGSLAECVPWSTCVDTNLKGIKGTYIVGGNSNDHM